MPDCCLPCSAEFCKILGQSHRCGLEICLGRGKENRIYTCLKISGKDRESFLQGQLTQDVTRLPTSGAVATAWCSPKGRVIVTGLLIPLGEAIGLVMPSDAVDAVSRRLTMYRLRSKVDISVDDDVLSVAMSKDRLGSIEAPAGISVVALTDGVIEAHGRRDAFDQAKLNPAQALTNDQWRSARVRAGWVDIHADNSERYTPHMLNLDRTGGVSFDKGCYTGQEVVARTEHRGRVKRRTYRFGHDAGAVSVGDRLLDDGEEAGTVVNVADGELLAVTSTASARDGLTVNGARARLLSLPYPLD